MSRAFSPPSFKVLSSRSRALPDVDSRRLARSNGHSKSIPNMLIDMFKAYKISRQQSKKYDIFRHVVDRS